ncbi:MAG: hypothetical protein AAB877_03545 [Patescibacteria group bacterium]
MKEFIKQNWFKLSFATSVILIGVSIFYYFVIFIPEKEEIRVKQEQLKIEQAKQEEVDKQTKEEQAKLESKEALDSCISSAKSHYTELWNNECEYLGEISTTCKEILDLSYQEYLEKYKLTADDYKKQRGITAEFFGDITDYYQRRDDCSCRLPTAKADRVDDTLQKDKEECFKKYPQK